MHPKRSQPQSTNLRKAFSPELIATQMSRKKQSPRINTEFRTDLSRQSIAALLIALVTLIAFSPILRNQFVEWDDYENLISNAHYRGLGWAQLSWMFTTFHMGPYQPLSWMSLGLDYLIWGMNPAGYHLTSLLLHASASSSPEPIEIWPEAKGRRFLMS